MATYFILNALGNLRSLIGTILGLSLREKVLFYLTDVAGLFYNGSILMECSSYITLSYLLKEILP